jgi:hypothetical protein
MGTVAKALTRGLLCEVASAILREKDPVNNFIVPDGEFAAYLWLGHIDRLHDEGRISDEEYFEYMQLFPDDHYRVDRKRLLARIIHEDSGDTKASAW